MTGAADAACSRSHCHLNCDHPRQKSTKWSHISFNKLNFNTNVFLLFLSIYLFTPVSSTLQNFADQASDVPDVRLPQPGQQAFILEKGIFVLRCYSRFKENVFEKTEGDLNLDGDKNLKLKSYRLNENDLPPEPYRNDAKFYTSLQFTQADASHSGHYVCHTINPETGEKEFLYEWDVTVITDSTIEANDVTYRKSPKQREVTLQCKSLAGPLIPVEWVKNDIAIPPCFKPSPGFCSDPDFGNGRYKYRLEQGNLTFVDAHRLTSGEHHFNCRLIPGALQAAAGTGALQSLIEKRITLKVLPRSRASRNNVKSNSEEVQEVVVAENEKAQADENTKSEPIVSGPVEPIQSATSENTKRSYETQPGSAHKLSSVIIPLTVCLVASFLY